MENFPALLRCGNVSHCQSKRINPELDILKYFKYFPKLVFFFWKLQRLRVHMGDLSSFHRPKWHLTKTEFFCDHYSLCHHPLRNPIQYQINFRKIETAKTWELHSCDMNLLESDSLTQQLNPIFAVFKLR